MSESGKLLHPDAGSPFSLILDSLSFKALEYKVGPNASS